ncbi:hypothetical protein Q428_12320 [Fervidicella metallireducens AeB]|uniref:DNA2/NAM7 helicase-like C-terminal domain-containing protein n=1 Tax=Fervidicella metallireducens AeB TaxID=1403537 RepID=A0A017RUQ9_9CLOT|nr:ATP-binding protein [Fervidicella metallireducens]EYE87615.1 hypothetical protein Q428_12320 [Fervidicella metallireducens AeB]
MENEDLIDEWRKLMKLRNEYMKLKDKASRSCEIKCIDLFKKNNEPYSNKLQQLEKEEKINFLKNTYETLEKTSILVKQGLDRIENEIDTRIKQMIPKEIVDCEYRKKIAEYERLKEEYNRQNEIYKEKQKQWQLHKKYVCNYIEETNNDEELMCIVREKINGLIQIRNKEEHIRNKLENFLIEWTEKLNNTETIKNDQKYFIERYIDACNVVGITCTENSRTLDSKNLSYFDVAIIDEVSKATPPELLLPMVKAKKTILVGDHRQLPPLFKENQASYEELINQKKEELSEMDNNEESNLDIDETLTLENFEQYKEMVTASLFKNYFEIADDSLKKSLFVQYRMHPDIMDIINCFYENKLKCGLSADDIREKRDHKLEITTDEGLNFITRDKHVIWVDSSYSPDGNPFYEKQDGTSKVNLLEVFMIVKTLKKIDENYKMLGYGKNERKDVGVISFYGKQVKEIRKALKKYNFEAIKIDVNTVDKFQGKEKSIVLVSLVRNKRMKKKSEKSFVASFQRINVAFSRARELLIIFGAKEMFEDYYVDLPNMDREGKVSVQVYKNILTRIRIDGGLFKSSRILSESEYKELIGGENGDKEDRSIYSNT